MVEVSFLLGCDRDDFVVYQEQRKFAAKKNGILLHIRFNKNRTCRIDRNKQRLQKIKKTAIEM